MGSYPESGASGLDPGQLRTLGATLGLGTSRPSIILHAAKRPSGRYSSVPIAALIYYYMNLSYRASLQSYDQRGDHLVAFEDGRGVRRALLDVGLAIFIFAFLSALVGRTQPVSYLRFSSFFFPLLVIFSVICFGLFLSTLQRSPRVWGYSDRYCRYSF